ncbi:transcriptional regulator [[Haemophilus] felis]|uniref:DNA-binding protein n=1 Tax=[Haemophilus] felis TaxID=123822 RepID=A0A1T0B1W3_9PAST|nr:transcriptional regulator [[Haemophilus] felis]NBI40217.1 transcriptional regulator [[Haemophilus] felis]NBI43119.1 transcriptional regulator [[Haemophilus] felis]OOS04115.1 hypothetical protein B0188_05460 [[Haemophilus] felis]
MEKETKRLYDKKALAEILCTSTSTLNRRMRDDKHFPRPHLIFGKTYWTDIQVEEYIQFIHNGGYRN